MELTSREERGQQGLDRFENLLLRMRISLMIVVLSFDDGEIETQSRVTRACHRSFVSSNSFARKRRMMEVLKKKLTV